MQIERRRVLAVIAVDAQQLPVQLPVLLGIHQSAKGEVNRDAERWCWRSEQHCECATTTRTHNDDVISRLNLKESSRALNDVSSSNSHRSRLLMKRILTQCTVE